jgi:uncharacterized protein YutE (UPF0331/DUF86 family)
MATKSKKDVVLAKISIVRNCLASIQKVTDLNPDSLDDSFKQDVFVLNLERAAQACIDLANYLIAEKGLMMPASYKQAFFILQKANILSIEVSSQMQKMAGFRNIAVHDYQKLDINILKSILTKNLKSFEDFCHEAIAVDLI